jgi:hypothetical protein
MTKDKFLNELHDVCSGPEHTDYYTAIEFIELIADELTDEQKEGIVRKWKEINSK